MDDSVRVMLAFVARVPISLDPPQLPSPINPRPLGDGPVEFPVLVHIPSSAPVNGQPPGNIEALPNNPAEFQGPPRPRQVPNTGISTRTRAGSTRATRSNVQAGRARLFDGLK